ncbi:MAG: hypothetical protein ABI047_04555 [Jatrophihabitantaceae bacterium]
MTGLSQRPRGWIVGWAALVCGAIGVVAGLARGLTVYAPTAWAAAFEVGIPAAVAGAIIGLGTAGVRTIVRRIRARSA